MADLEYQHSLQASLGQQEYNLQQIFERKEAEKREEIACSDNLRKQLADIAINKQQCSSK